jgi:hypothetical protein
LNHVVQFHHLHGVQFLLLFHERFPKGPSPWRFSGLRSTPPYLRSLRNSILVETLVTRRVQRNRNYRRSLSLGQASQRFRYHSCCRNNSEQRTAIDPERARRRAGFASKELM